MVDMSKWPPSKDGKFTQAWINLKELPGGMMSANQPPCGFGPVPGTTHCSITTSPTQVEMWRSRGEPVLAICIADGVAAPVPEVDPMTLKSYAAWASEFVNKHGHPPTAAQVYEAFTRGVKGDGNG